MVIVHFLEACWIAKLSSVSRIFSGRRAKKPIHDGSQKNELNGYPETLVCNNQNFTCNTGRTIYGSIEFGNPASFQEMDYDH
jgi:hypothetical protein